MIGDVASSFFCYLFFKFWHYIFSVSAKGSNITVIYQGRFFLSFLSSLFISFRFLFVFIRGGCIWTVLSFYFLSFFFFIARAIISYHITSSSLSGFLIYHMFCVSVLYLFLSLLFSNMGWRLVRFTIPVAFFPSFLLCCAVLCCASASRSRSCSRSCSTFDVRISFPGGDGWEMGGVGGIVGWGGSDR